MSTQFTQAILRRPAATYAAGITTSAEGAPDLPVAEQEHGAYARALESLGLSLTVLEADNAYPDGVFVEDTAIITARGAILTRPGAASRQGEAIEIGQRLRERFGDIAMITAPGTVDGGDICETDDGVLIGLSARTNAAGAEQLAGWLRDLGYASQIIDIRPIPRLLHLKTGISYLGDGRMAVAGDLPPMPQFSRFEVVMTTPAEAYVANCVRVNHKVLVAAGYPRFADTLAGLGYDPLPLDMSEYRKMDGGLSCLSLRF